MNKTLLLLLLLSASPCFAAAAVDAAAVATPVVSDAVKHLACNRHRSGNGYESNWTWCADFETAAAARAAAAQAAIAAAKAAQDARVLQAVSP